MKSRDLVMMAFGAFLIGASSAGATEANVGSSPVEGRDVTIVSVQPRDPDVKPVIVTVPVAGSRNMADNDRKSNEQAGLQSSALSQEEK